MSATIPRSQRTPGRTAAIVIGVIALVAGVCTALAGGVLLLVFGSSGQLDTAQFPLSTPTAAVLTDTAKVSDTSVTVRAVGPATLRLQADGGNVSGLFVGIGPAAAVETYLQGVAVDLATDFDVDPYALTLTRRQGTAPAAAPAAQNFWVASATVSGDLTWTVRDGDYRMVVMNADGSPGVNSSLGVGIGIPGMFPLALMTLGVGLVLMLGGVLALVLGRSRRREFRG